MFCTNCGTQITEGSAFCPNCGAKLGNSTNSSQMMASSQVAPVYQQKKLFLSTLESVYGKEVELLGIVKGSVVSSRNVGKDFLASFKNMAGGEIKSYTELATIARATATERMEAEARVLDADAILGVRYTSAPISVEGAIEVLVYGTAVKYKNISDD